MVLKLENTLETPGELVRPEAIYLWVTKYPDGFHLTWPTLRARGPGLGFGRQLEIPWLQSTHTLASAHWLLVEHLYCDGYSAKDLPIPSFNPLN